MLMRTNEIAVVQTFVLKDVRRRMLDYFASSASKEEKERARKVKIKTPS